jgi:hypothetical protein
MTAANCAAGFLQKVDNNQLTAAIGCPFSCIEQALYLQPLILLRKWCRLGDLNTRPHHYE